MKNELHIIDLLGGPKRVAEMLGIIGDRGAVQRVCNWKRRGIPPGVLLAHPDFHRKVKKAERELKEATHA
jgi:hypothetical protein